MKRTLNIYRQWNFARYAFNVACENLKEGDIASHRDLTIKSKSNITFFACYTSEKDFCQRCLYGQVWNEINDYANLPYDVWTMAQSRIRG